MNRTFVVVLAGALFGLIGLGSAFGFASLRLNSQRPDWERLAMLGLPVLWAAGGVVLASALSDRERR